MKIIAKFSIGLLCLLVLWSCNAQKKLMDSWLGDTKVHLIEQWGPPERVASNGSTGQILIYAGQSYNPFTRSNFYHYSMFYADDAGKIYRWMTRDGMIPPQQLNLDVYVH